MTDSDEVKLLPCDLDDATAEQIERANEAVSYQMNDDGTPKWQSAQGYACALTAIMLSDARPPVVTDEVVERVATLRGALETCAKTFRRYSELHRAKGTTEGNLKASNNDDLAEFCESVLADDGAIASMPAVVSGGQP